MRVKKSTTWMILTIVGALNLIAFQNCGEVSGGFAVDSGALGSSGTGDTSLGGDVTVKLAWDAVTDAALAGYKVYVGTSPGVYTSTVDAKLTGSPVSPMFSVTGLLPNVRYYFVVKAYDGSMNESEASNEVSAL